MALSAHDLKIRSTAVWSTEAAAALGMSKYSTPVQLWLEKTGKNSLSDQGEEENDAQEIDNDDEAETEAQSMGLILQPVIGRLYEQRTGRKLDDMEGVTMISDSHPFMASHFDYKVAGKRHLVECKNFHSIRRREFGEEGSDDIPMDCLVQCLHEGHVAKADVVDLAVLFGGQKFEIFTVPIRSDAVDMLVDKLQNFWQFVESGEPPPAQTDEEVKALWRRDNGQEIIATQIIEGYCEQLALIKAEIKEATEKQKLYEVAIKNFIGNSAVLRSADRSMILSTWKNSKDKLSFNKAQFFADHPSLAERYTSMVPGSRRFLLK